MASLPLLQPGTQIGGQYRVDTLINRGGFGAVYRGYDTGENSRLCAIKETYDISPAARRKALREVGILLTVKNQHLPEVYDAFEDNGRFYVVMQLIEGQNLLQMLHMHRVPFSEQQVLAWLLPIMDILHELHTRPSPVIHRDIKPANIIIAPKQCAVLVDFGLTRLYNPENTTETIERAVSHGFSPIEQYLGTTSPLSDMYSLAATIYMLVTNITPPSAMQRSYLDELIAIRLLNPTLSPHLEYALTQALALKPENRFQSMEAFAQALRNSAFRAYNDQTSATQQMPTRPTNTPRHVPLSARSSIYEQQPAAHISTVRDAASAGTKSSNTGKSTPSYTNVRPAIPRPRQRQSTGRILVPARPLPSVFNQGCMWGVFQGVLAALIVLLLRKEADFYMAIATGFVCYFIAGFLTMRNGGRSSRGAEAGFWAGIISTIVFWLLLVVGLFVIVLVQFSHSTPHTNTALYRAWHLVMPVMNNHTIVQMRLTLVITIFLGCGLLLAIGFGWLGGILAKANYKAKLRAKRGA